MLSAAVYCIIMQYLIMTLYNAAIPDNTKRLRSVKPLKEWINVDETVTADKIMQGRIHGVAKGSSSIQEMPIESSAKTQFNLDKRSQPTKPQLGEAKTEPGLDEGAVIDVAEDVEFTPIRHIFQYGPPRTASTTQFNIICVGLFLHIRAHSPDLLNHTICTYAGSFKNESEAYKFMLQQDNIPQAVKSHVTEPDPRQIHNSTFVFATASTKNDTEKLTPALKKQWPNTGIIQDLETLKEVGIDYWLSMYANFFALSSEDLNLMSEYFQKWSKLRQCCGLQMSKSFRNDILQPSQKNPLIKPHPFCELADAESMESSFMSTKLYKIIAQYPLVRKMNRPALVDGDLDGTYCKRYNAAVHEHGIPGSSEAVDGLNSVYNGMQTHWGEELFDPLVAIRHLIQKKLVEEVDGPKITKAVEVQHETELPAAQANTADMMTSKDQAVIFLLNSTKTDEVQHKIDLFEAKANAAGEMTSEVQAFSLNSTKAEEVQHEIQSAAKAEANAVDKMASKDQAFSFSPWVQDYISFHQSSVADGKLKDGARYIVYECKDGSIPCGGAGDRLIGMIKMFYLALCSRRVLVIDAPFPIPLEQVLNPSHIEWNVSFPETHLYFPDMKYNESAPLGLREEIQGYRIYRTNAHPRKKDLGEILNSNLMTKHLEQNQWLGKANSVTLAAASSEAFRAMFKFDPIVIARAQEFKASAGITGPYAGLHMRKGDSNMGVTGQSKAELGGLKSRETDNSKLLDCYHQVKTLHSNAFSVAYLASDDVDTKQAMAKADSSIHFAHNMKPFHVDLLARDGSNKNIDATDQAVTQGVIDTWAEMLVLSESTCLLLSQSMFSFGSLYIRGARDCVVHLESCHIPLHREGHYSYYGENIAEKVGLSVTVEREK